MEDKGTRVKQGEAKCKEVILKTLASHKGTLNCNQCGIWMLHSDNVQVLRLRLKSVATHSSCTYQSIKQGLWHQWARLCQVLGQQFVSNASAQRELGSKIGRAHV